MFFERYFGNHGMVKAVYTRNWEKVIEILEKRRRKAKVKYRIVSESGQARTLPLHHCLMFNPPERVVSALLKAYPNGIHVCDKPHKRFPLHIACQYNAGSKIIKLLLQKAPEIIAKKDKRGRYPLHHAIENGPNFMAIAMMLDHSESIAKLPDEKGLYPLHMACEMELPHAVVQEIIDAWPQAIIKMVHGKTPYDIALNKNAIDKDLLLQILEEEKERLLDHVNNYAMM